MEVTALVLFGVLMVWLALALAVGLLFGALVRRRDRVGPRSVPERRHERLRRVV